MDPAGSDLTPQAWQQALTLIGLMHRARRRHLPMTTRERAAFQRTVEAVPAANLDLGYLVLVDMLVDEIAALHSVDSTTVLNDRLSKLADADPFDDA